jgi:pimeloyl-ACP methyl ester carboxylesterase
MRLSAALHRQETPNHDRHPPVSPAELSGIRTRRLAAAHQRDQIVTHGWPGSVIEQLKIIEPLTNPTAHGAAAADAFHLVIPSLPGYGFSAKPTTTGWDPVRTRAPGPS